MLWVVIDMLATTAAVWEGGEEVRVIVPRMSRRR